MAELVSKCLNEKTLKSKETLIHKINRLNFSTLDQSNLLLASKIMKSKDFK